MQIMNWIEIEPAGNGASKLDAGAYVLRIKDVSEHTSRNGGGYLTFVYDIAEGEHANHFANETADYRHSFNRNYTGKAAPFFRSFLDAVEQSNPGHFNIASWQKTCDVRAFVGLTVGALFRDRYYTNSSGKDVGPILDFVRAMPAQDVRDGNWSVPPVKDDRSKTATPIDGYYAAPAAKPDDDTSVYDSDLPF